MLSDSWKIALNWPWKTPKKNIAKKYEKHEIVRFFFFLAIFEALAIHSTNFLRPLFNSFNFYFGHKTPHGLKTWEN